MIQISNCEIVAQSDRILSLKLPVIAVDSVAHLCSKSKLRHNGYIAIRLELPHKPRTTGEDSQNHRLNGFVAQFCEYTGNDFADIKLHVKRRAMRRGLPAMTNDKGEIIYSKVDREPLPKSEADMSTVECSWVLEELDQFLAEEEFVPVEIDKDHKK